MLQKHLSGIDATVGRSGPPVPIHVEPEPEYRSHRRARRRRDQVCANQGSAGDSTAAASGQNGSKFVLVEVIAATSRCSPA